ncbi:MAG: hypothetical protein ACREOI_31955 [bacterium]
MNLVQKNGGVKNNEEGAVKGKNGLVKATVVERTRPLPLMMKSSG